MAGIGAEKIIQFTGHAGAVYAVCAAETTSTVFTAGSDGIIARWDIAGGVSKSALARVPGPVFSMLHLREKAQLWLGRDDGSIHVIDIRAQKEVKLLKNHSKGVFCLIEFEGKVFAGGGDGTVSRINTESLQTELVFQASSEKVRTVLADKNTNSLFIASADGYVRIFELDALRPVKQWKAHENAANTLLLLPGNTLLTGGRDALLRFWDLNRDEMVPMNTILAHNYAIYKVEAYPEEGIFISCSRDKTLKIWDMNTHEVLFRISLQTAGGHRNSVNSFLFDAESRRLVSVSDDSVVMVWQINGLPNN